jgi:pyridoxal phosphate enzyme (YggS family)
MSWDNLRVESPKTLASPVSNVGEGSYAQLQADEKLAARKVELASRLEALNGQLAEAARTADRRPEEITLIAVTKTRPFSDLLALAELGVRDVGENKAQEMMSKHEQARLIFSAKGSPNRFAAELKWHFVGQLQRNKSAVVARYADCVQSIDRVSVVEALARAIQAAERPVLDCLIQVNLDIEPVAGRAGVAPARVAELAEQVLAAPGLRLAGVMGVAPRNGDARSAFDLLAHAHQQVLDLDRSAQVFSAGMSGDFAQAIAAGATHVRLGSALLGERQQLVR